MECTRYSGIECYNHHIYKVIQPNFLKVVGKTSEYSPNTAPSDESTRAQIPVIQELRFILIRFREPSWHSMKLRGSTVALSRLAYLSS
jgi:hypothetical protein